MLSVFRVAPFSETTAFQGGPDIQNSTTYHTNFKKFMHVQFTNVYKVLPSSTKLLIQEVLTSELGLYVGVLMYGNSFARLPIH